MRTLRFHTHGPALDVLRLEEAEAPVPGPGQIRVAVQACGLTPADWALAEGLFAGELPRGIGLEVSGTVDAAGPGVTGTAIGDAVFGPVPFRGPTAGASDHALLDVWFPRPERLQPDAAAALPMAVETAHRGLDGLGVRPGFADGLVVLVHGAGSTVGYAAAQIALRYGARVIATAGPTYADALRALGAEVTGHGDGMAERVRALAGGPVDLAFDAAPISNSLPELVRTVAKPADVMTMSDFAAAQELGVRFQFGENGNEYHHHVLGEYARLAADGAFSVPVARVFPLEDWRAAAERSLSGNAGGKLVLRLA
ncbi:NADP-dependent oxidoreductase [Actinacidiphila acidipaludis]|uniref:NADP-dependent oxidoreductase n=1 Tax=Actinacidiphila acidipaludis TaxID=2873382 RepID=A0ABS7Q956_9ACTN|nr:NADP-dependent oxidoreductase [Streptomyces acidipaludis]MBY8878970.1 NADP-dependent oxidoreductase [Streptomyces acidipaludis]